MGDIDLKTNIDDKESKNESENEQDEEIVIKEKPKKESLRARIKKFFENPKKRLIFIGSVGLLFIIIFGIGIFFLTHEKNQVSSNKTPEKTEAKKLYQSILDGTMIEDESAANRHPLAIIVENDPGARPQSGLDKANIVYETVYDPAATTRFMAIFGNTEAEKVGPIRSVRTFFVDWAHGLDAYLGHWGGNVDALDKISKENAPDLDEFRYAGLYWRDKSSGTSSEHTGYTSTLKLREQAEKNGYSSANNFNIYKFKDDPVSTDPAVAPISQELTIDFSNASYLVNFKYDSTTNSYKRYLAGSPHNDSVTKTQLMAKNIVIMAVNRAQTTTRINESGYTMTTVGTGKAKFVLDGKVTLGTWKKDSVSEREMFYDENGTEIVFNRGKFWICVVADLNSATIK